jgi:hypothetical protein
VASAVSLVGLRSQSLLALLAVATVALLAVALWRWPALGRRGAGAVLLRIGLLAALQASALGLIFVWVNRSQEFYASWSDLLGTGAVAGRIVPAGGTLAVRATAAVPAIPLTGTAERFAGPGGRPAGRLLTARFTGAVSGLSAPGYVFLPPGYAPAGPRLPVLVLISGEVRAAAAAYGARQVAATASAGMAAGWLPKMIMVMLPPAVAGPASQGCLDLPGGAQAATYFTQDVPRLVRAAFRASLLSSHWAVLGDQGGGYCALQLATSAAGPFAAAAVPVGSYRSAPGVSGLTPWLRRQDSVQWRLRHWPPPPLQVLLTGPGSPGALGALARPPLQITGLTLAPGRQPLAPVLAWLGRAVTAPAHGVMIRDGGGGTWG